jgi:site-specific DNA-methyltransferase (adenine-specific)
MTTTDTTPNRLYFGDNLDILRHHVADESVDLIYLDPPFNSKRLYNAFIGGSQWVAFDDTWRWYEAEADFHEVARQPKYRGLMEGLRLMLGEGPQLAYLSYMANRLLECHRVLKPTGSIYLHCDPTMSHYLKTVMDGTFVRGGYVQE